MSGADASPDRLRAIDAAFERALDLEAEERSGLLAELRAGDSALAAEVEHLLEMAAEPDGRLTARHLLGGPLGAATGGPLATPAEAAPGDRIGPYRVVSELGRGGMAAVYEAERADGAYDQRVALKLLAGGMTSAEAGRRFEQERQILASLDHPSIARLLDGGFDARGRPYLVMELVDGLPLDRFCDQRGLTVDQRLDLLLEVGRAVEHAHTRLVVHRDLKPSNILVTAAGQVKLLDFGIAKLLDPSAAGRFAAPPTRTLARLLTPEYASPEQARGEAITTASDVYQLGLLLYELLTGRRPFSFRAGSAAEIERILTSAPPPVPSTCEISEAAARARGATPIQLARRLRGDLDSILLKALRKEPSLRYASPAELARDIEAHRAGLPVAAVRGTRVYRLRKFAGRHRLALAAASGLAALLVGYAVTVSVQSAEVARQRDRAEAEAAKAKEVTRLLVDLFEVADPDVARGREPTVGELLDRGRDRLSTELVDQPEVRAELLGTVGEIYRKLGRYDRAEPLLREALATATATQGADALERAAALAALGRLLRVQDRHEEAETALRSAVDIRERGLGAEHLEVAATLRELGAVLRARGRLADAAVVVERALAIQRRQLGARHVEVASTLGSLGSIRRAAGDFAAAADLHSEALALRRQALPPDHPDLAASLQNLALVRRDQGDYERAEPLFREAAAVYRKALGEDHPYLATTLSNLASMLTRLDRTEEAEALLREALAIRRRALGETHPAVAQTLSDLALSLQRSGDLGAAEPYFRQALLVLPPHHADRPTVQLNLGLLQQRRGNLEEAERLLRESLKSNRARFEDTHPTVAVHRLHLGELLRERRALAEAEALLRQALQVVDASFPRDHPWRAKALLALGRVLLDGRRLREAEPLLAEAEALYSSRFGATSANAVNARRELDHCRALIRSSTTER